MHPQHSGHAAVPYMCSRMRASTGLFKPYGVSVLPAPEAAALPPLPVAMSVQDGRAALKGFLRRVLDEADPEKVYVARADAGIGKTRTILQELARLKSAGRLSGKCFFAVPDTRTRPQDEVPSMGQEVAAIATSFGLDVHVYEGRDDTNCQNYECVRPIQSVGTSPTRVCGKPVSADPEEAAAVPPEMSCRFRRSCQDTGYWAQRIKLQDVDLVVIPHALLSVDWQKTLLRDLTVTMLIIDETFFGAVTRAPEVPIDKLLSPIRQDWTGTRGNIDESDIRNRIPVNRVIETAIFEGRDPAADIHADDQRRRSLVVASQFLDRFLEGDNSICPTTTPELAKLYAETLDRAGRPAESKMLRILVDRVGQLCKGLPLATNRQIEAITKESGGETRRYVRISWVSGSWQRNIEGDNADGERNSIPVLILDASAEPLIVERLFPGRTIEWHDIQIAAPWKTVIQCPDRTNAQSSLIATANAADGTVTAAARRLTQTVQALQGLSNRHPAGLLIVAAKKVRQAIQDTWQADETIPQRIHWAHFGNLRGKNAWKNVEACVIVGRQMPPTSVIDGYVAALSSGDPIPPPAFDRLVMKPGQYRLADGSVATKLVPSAPNDLAAAILRAIREAEIMQAIGRLRLADRTEDRPGCIYVLTSVPLPIAIDALVSERDFGSRPHPLAQATQQLGGVLPVSAPFLAEVVAGTVPELDTEDKAGKALRRAGLSVEALVSKGPNFEAAKVLRVTIKALAASKGVVRQTAPATALPSPERENDLTATSIVLFHEKGKRGRASAAIVLASAGDPVEAVRALLARHGRELGHCEIVRPVPESLAKACPATNLADEETTELARPLNKDGDRLAPAKAAITLAWLHDKETSGPSPVPNARELFLAWSPDQMAPGIGC